MQAGRSPQHWDLRVRNIAKELIELMDLIQRVGICA